MCIGRSRKFEPAVSARFLSEGPRSTVIDVTKPAASSATITPSTRTTGCFFRFVPFAADTSGSAVAGAAASLGGSRRLSVNDHQYSARFDGRAGRNRHVLHPAGLGRSQLVLHLHRLDDRDGL